MSEEKKWGLSLSTWMLLGIIFQGGCMLGLIALIVSPTPILIALPIIVVVLGYSQLIHPIGKEKEKGE